MGTGLHVDLVKGHPFAIAALIPIGEQGQELPGIYCGRSVFRGSTVFTFLSEGRLPAEMGLRAEIDDKLKEYDVTFEMADLDVPKVPPRQSRPY